MANQPTTGQTQSDFIPVHLCESCSSLWAGSASLFTIHGTALPPRASQLLPKHPAPGVIDHPGSVTRPARSFGREQGASPPHPAPAGLTGDRWGGAA